MKTFVETFQDSIDMTDGTTIINEKDFRAIQLDAQLPAKLSDEEVDKLANSYATMYDYAFSSKEQIANTFRDAITEALSLVQGGSEDTEMLDWLGKNSVLDGEEILVTKPIRFADTLRHAIRSAMKK